MIEANVPLNKWKGILVSKLSVKTEKTCAHLAHNSDTTYADIKKHLLRHVGPSADELCNIVHGAAHAEFRDKSETQKLQHTKYVAERYFLGVQKPEQAIIHHMAIRMYKFHCNKKFAHTIKLSKQQCLAEVLELTSSFDSQLDFEKSKTDRPNNTYYRSDKTNNTYSKPFRKTMFCEYCRKTGHQESDCFKKQNASRQEPFRQNKTAYKPNTQDSNPQNNYFKQNKQQKEVGIKTRPATVNWSHTNTTVDSIKGLVNGHEADIILDTGAQVTVVPGKFVYSDNLTGETISILGVNGSPMPYQLASIPITLDDTTVQETVAVASEDQLNSKVLLATPISKLTEKHLLKSYLDKHTAIYQVQTVTRSKTTPKTPINYFEEDTNSYNEDDRVSDSSYTPDTDSDYTDREYSDSDTKSEGESQGKPNAPEHKYLNALHLPFSPRQPNDQTLTPLTEPYSSNNSNTLTKP